ncbi:hypothetical protein SDC9_135538 [bioreactor metagenome]|uniref:Uncharacterized protein n=1 Tax=bioreactor metagenome TaxID=1076179 RepID=A0A645DG50_9ZZZZ
MAGTHLRHHVGHEALRKGFFKKGDRVADDAEGMRRLFRGALLRLFDRLVKRTDDLVEVVLCDAALQRLDVGVDDDRDAAVHLHRPGLVAAHSTGSSREKDAVFHISAVMFDANGGKRLKGALDDSLGPDIFPRRRRVLRKDGKILRFKIVECLP